MRSKGELAELRACEYLQKQGLTLLERNYRVSYGEIDLIMQDQDIIVFVEVKFRSSVRYGDPLEAVDLRKQAKITSVARHYLATLQNERLCRFDVIGILGNKIRWVKGAFP